MAGKFYSQPEKETTLWEDRRRRLPFGLPWTLTKYILTDARLKINSGFFRRREETIQLYRITDASLTRTIGERLCRTGTITIVSSDATTPIIKLYHVKQSGKVRDLLSQTVESARIAAGVNTAELVGGAARPGMPPPPPPNPQ